MAGISATLRPLLERGTHLSLAAAYGYAATAMAGPWILASFLLWGIRVADLPSLEPGNQAAFPALVVHAACATMILTGPLQLICARHVSDLLYQGRRGRVVPVFMAASLTALGANALAGAAFAALVGLPLVLAGAAVALFAMFGAVWMSVVFLGTLRRYILIVFGFVAGTALGYVYCLYFGRRLGLAGLVGGFALSQGVVWAVLSACIRTQFPPSGSFDFGFLKTASKFLSLPAIGLLYYAGIWIDRVIFWTGPYASYAGQGLRSFPMYDNALFLALLTVLPSLALVFLQIEVAYYDIYSAFYRAVRRGADLGKIRRLRAAIETSFRDCFASIVCVQGVATLLAVVLAPMIFARLRFDWVELPVFRIACLGAFLHVLVLGTVLAALHLAFYRLALGISAVYATVGAAATWMAMVGGMRWFGCGYVAAGMAALLVGVPLLERKLRRLDCDLFSTQPV
ncbi:MAG: exopolysaccharide Pel transporter PelG [Planctomycetes bacterium]|nr:exopolysaccharide Pel transporter PelG [Planctomycetota bacterium]